MQSARKVLFATVVSSGLLVACTVDRVANDGGAGSDGTAGTGGTRGSGGAAGGGSAGVAGTGSGGAAGADQCRVDADCPAIACLVAPCPDSLCVMGGDGFHHCQTRRSSALQVCPSPAQGGDLTCCHSDADCGAQPRGRCVANSDGWCGGPAPPPGNQCRYDACTGDADCAAAPGGFCTGGSPRACVYGPCRTSADCTRRPGGICAVQSVGRFCASTLAFCRYAGDPCAVDADCHGDAGAFGLQCVPNSDFQGTTCQPVTPPPP
jgi:hypothetical protein